jgi:hypothetical protein
MDKEITVVLTPKLIRMSLYYRLRVAGLYFLSIFSIIILFLISTAVSYGRPPVLLWFNQCAYLLLILVFLFFIYFSAYRKGIALIKKMKNPAIKYRFTDERLYSNSDISTSDCAWSLFDSLWKYKKIWQLKLHSNAYLVFPADQLDDEMKALLTAKVPKPKITFRRIFLILFYLFILACLFCSYFRGFFEK